MGDRFNPLPGILQPGGYVGDQRITTDRRGLHIGRDLVQDYHGTPYVGDNPLTIRGSRIWIGPEEVLVQGNVTYVGNRKVFPPR